MRSTAFAAALVLCLAPGRPSAEPAAVLGRAADNSIALSVAARPNPVSLSESVTLVISLTNRSDKPRYIHRNVEPTLDFAVRDVTGHLVRYFNDPPLMPREFREARDFVRIASWRSYRCVVDLPLPHLGIERTGVFSVFGFWAGVSTKVPKVGAKEEVHFEDAEATYLTVVDDKTAATIGPQPTPWMPHGDLPSCVAT